MPVARPRRRRVRSRGQFEKWMLVRLRVVTLHPGKASVLEKAREFVLATIYRPIPTAPQGGIPSVLLDSPYPSVHVGRTEYKQLNLNRRLIDRRKSMARLEDVAFAAASVEKFVLVAPVDLFAQAIYVNLDRV